MPSMPEVINGEMSVIHHIAMVRHEPGRLGVVPNSIVTSIVGVHLLPIGCSRCISGRNGAQLCALATWGLRVAHGSGISTQSSKDGWTLVRPIGVFLHVFGQIGLLGVTFATILANVSLQVFGLLVLRNVLKESGFVGEAFVARITLVGLVSLMAAGVGLKIGELGECLRATHVSTSVGLVSSVGPDVLL